MPLPPNADRIERLSWVVEQLAVARRMADEIGENNLSQLLEQALVQAERDRQSAALNKLIL